MRINAHGHLLPYPHDIPNFMRTQGIFWISDDGKYMCQGNWKRPITDRSFYLEEKIEWMDKNEIDKEVILNLSQLYCNGMSRQTTKDVLRFQNDFNRSIQAAHPDKFYGAFVVQPKYLDDAIDEIKGCTEGENPMKIVCLPTHFLTEDDRWLSIADESLTPIYELIDDLGLALEIHPYDAEKIIHLKDEFWRFHLIWMCAQTADTWHRFSLLDFPHRYKNIRTCFAHGNQVGLTLYGRRLQGFNGRKDLFTDAISPQKTLVCENVFVDSIVHDVSTFRMVKERIGVDQIVAGIDDPYPLGEMESVEDSYPGKVLDDAVDAQILSDQERSKIWNTNVVRWIG